MRCERGTNAGERGRALDVPALTQRLERQSAQDGVGDLAGTPAPARELAADAREDARPVAQRRGAEHTGQRETLAHAALLPTVTVHERCTYFVRLGHGTLTSIGTVSPL